jgi:hypothetical protein
MSLWTTSGFDVRRFLSFGMCAVFPSVPMAQAGFITPPTAVGVGAGARFVTVADFNGDGIPDLAVANYYDSSVSVLLGNGDGTFRAGSTLGVALGANSIAVADFNGDGKQDIVVTCFYEGGPKDPVGPTSEMRIFLGNGDGTFAGGRI